MQFNKFGPFLVETTSNLRKTNQTRCGVNRNRSHSSPQKHGNAKSFRITES